MPMQAHLASDQWSSGRQLEGSDALAMLRRWHAETAKLGFGYFRSGGGVLQTGSATLLRVTPDLLTLDTGGSRLAVMLAKARFQFGDLGFMTPDFRGTLGVQGLSFFLSNNDWMFLFSGADELDASALTKHLETLLPSRTRSVVPAAEQAVADRDTQSRARRERGVAIVRSRRA